MKSNKIWQKRLHLERAIRTFSSGSGFARNGERNPFHFPGVLALTMHRSRDNRRVERRVISRNGYNLLSHISDEVAKHPGLSSALAIAPHSRAYEDRDGTDVVIWVLDPGQVHVLPKVLKKILKGDPRLSDFECSPIARGAVAPLLRAMYFEAGECPDSTIVYL